MAKKASAAKKSTRPALATAEAVATIGVKSVKAARKFYEETLGFDPEDIRDGDVVTYASAGSRLFVYESQFAGSNRATAVTWVSDDVDAVVQDLKGRGVEFEHYDFPEREARGRRPRVGIHAGGLVQGPGRKHPRGRQRRVAALLNMKTVR